MPVDRRRFLALTALASIAPRGVLAATARQPHMLQMNGFPVNAETPLELLTDSITPTGLFFLRSHWMASAAPTVGKRRLDSTTAALIASGDPDDLDVQVVRIDPDRWKLNPCRRRDLGAPRSDDHCERVALSSWQSISFFDVDGKPKIVMPIAGRVTAMTPGWPCRRARELSSAAIPQPRPSRTSASTSPATVCRCSSARPGASRRLAADLP